ncbi:MAG: hypothetical protein QM775_02610 [Pirellulales bacterium]
MLVSFIVHLGLIIALGLMHTPEIKRDRVIIMSSTETPPPPSFSEIRGLAPSMDAVQMESFRPLARLPELPKQVKVNVVAPGVGLPATALAMPADLLPAAFAGRGMKGQLLGDKGGTIQTEEAVEAGLRWLANHQLPNGFWSLTGTQRGRPPIRKAQASKIRKPPRPWPSWLSSVQGTRRRITVLTRK